ncbi:esterase family protein [Naasia sp. SYSU D00057]|uniref:alpha/beta hydrolase n=1 Tax=Naasia sp. SYSU D00057 TaxID=2817380 RepID=UPI001B30B78C|nr:alpha/beta hydrolase-fold protein [Naasia sp. SYSU D00057]
MPSWIEEISIVDGPAFIAPFAATIALVVFLFLPGPGVRRSARAQLTTTAVAGLVGGIGGALAVWLVSDVVDAFGVSLSWTIRIADALAFAGLGIAVANFWGTRWQRKAAAFLTSGLLALSLSLVFNVDFAQYPRLGDALATTYSEDAELPRRVADPVPVEEWTAPEDLPERGSVGKVDIPATESGFPARGAYVYLPPAAYAAEPPALPVVVAMAGQPGEPADIFRAGQVDRILDAVAADHDGLAPIVVVPDQLGDPTVNPMCLDGPYGDSETYLTVDVPDWIRSSLNVSDDPADWTVTGFSQGGTCSLQLAAAHPELFGALLDIAGEEAPSLGSVEETIERGFGGDEDAYRAATPAAILQANAPYEDSVALFAAGERDRKYSASMRTVSALAAEAGMAVTVLVSPGTAHDWNTARYGLREGFAQLLPRWGIDG